MGKCLKGKIYKCEDSNLGVKLIWPHLNSYCPYTGVFPVQKNQIRFIKLLNEYLVIRNGENIIESRLLDVLSEMGIKEFPKNLEFKNYQLI